MARMKKTKKYYFTVEGETELLQVRLYESDI